MRALLIWMMLAGAALGQSAEVRPGEIELTVTVEDVGTFPEAGPLTGEMVLVTIHGVYRRHIARERLEQPELEGFAWMQLGQDHWYETRERGQPVKNFRRRMALFAEEPGPVEIGAFTHHLTLIDENDDWFDHDLASEPVTVQVAEAPGDARWWFPVRRLVVTDSWSNAPDQLAPGAGVLRIVRVAATGAAPQMIPPMPDLRSPTGLVFAHPEQRLVELSPEGPVSVAFWRWTIQPGNGVSAITEPMEFDWYDTAERQPRRVRIGAQRVAYAAPIAAVPAPGKAGTVRAGLSLGAFGAALAVGLVALLWGRRWARPGFADPLRWQVRRAARAGDLAALRRAGAALARQGRSSPASQRAMAELDAALFGKGAARPDPRALAHALLARPTDTDG
ncbi:protein BatD [Oceanicola sp. D3]|uniref:BatD family protein n=1 Tax=Oceanicola sp. D3 TaxID=2587163 RepID=UPI0011240E03|nr:BatD family protein [Oceanicola sp. D3]QDC09873.1 protein BatD [Oceanicola sp. D3]